MHHASGDIVCMINAKTSYFLCWIVVTSYGWKMYAAFSRKWQPFYFISCVNIDPLSFCNIGTACLWYWQGKTGRKVDVLCPQLREPVDIESLTEALRTGPYGRCVYDCDNDVVSNQLVLAIICGAFRLPLLPKNKSNPTSQTQHYSRKNRVMIIIVTLIGDQNKQTNKH